jgi:hypothetical protein
LIDILPWLELEMLAAEGLANLFIKSDFCIEFEPGTFLSLLLETEPVFEGNMLYCTCFSMLNPKDFLGSLFLAFFVIDANFISIWFIFFIFCNSYSCL